jgi:peptidoglycan hydrolase-like protein with peptidoglycan-binding domain
MKTTPAIFAVLALGSFAALPSCSMMGTHNSGTQTSSAASTSRTALSPDMVKEVQLSLQKDGTYKGNVDGVWGPDTKAALQSYQQSHNLTADGQLDSATLASLNLPKPGAPTTASSMEPSSTPGAAPSTPAVSSPPMPPANSNP